MKSKELIELIAEFTRAVYYLMDNSEETDDGISVTKEDFQDVSDLLDKIEALPEDPTCVAGPAKKLRNELESMVSKYRGALRPFVDYAQLSGAKYLTDDLNITHGSLLAARQLTMGDCRQAAKAFNDEDS